MAEYCGYYHNGFDPAGRFYGNRYIKLAGGTAPDYHAAGDGAALCLDLGALDQTKEDG